MTENSKVNKLLKNTFLIMRGCADVLWGSDFGIDTNFNVAEKKNEILQSFWYVLIRILDPIQRIQKQYFF